MNFYITVLMLLQVLKWAANDNTSGFSMTSSDRSVSINRGISTNAIGMNMNPFAGELMSRPLFIAVPGLILLVWLMYFLVP